MVPQKPAASDPASHAGAEELGLLRHVDTSKVRYGAILGGVVSRVSLIASYVDSVL